MGLTRPNIKSCAVTSYNLFKKKSKENKMNLYEIQYYSLKITYGPESELSWYTVCSQNAVK